MLLHPECPACGAFVFLAWAIRGRPARCCQPRCTLPASPANTVHLCPAEICAGRTACARRPRPSRTRQASLERSIQSGRATARVPSGHAVAKAGVVRPGPAATCRDRCWPGCAEVRSAIPQAATRVASGADAARRHRTHLGSTTAAGGAHGRADAYPRGEVEARVTPATSLTLQALDATCRGLPLCRCGWLFRTTLHRGTKNDVPRFGRGSPSFVRTKDRGPMPAPTVHLRTTSAALS